MPPHREGGQLQYSAPPHAAQIDGTLAPLLEWATERLGEPLTIESLAAHAGVSGRTLARRVGLSRPTISADVSSTTSAQPRAPTAEPSRPSRDDQGGAGYGGGVGMTSVRCPPAVE